MRKTECGTLNLNLLTQYFCIRVTLIGGNDQYIKLYTCSCAVWSLGYINSSINLTTSSYLPREEILQAAKAVAQATEDLVQKAQGCDSMGEDSPDSGNQLAGLQTTSGREEVSLAARHAVTTLVSQARIVSTGAATLTGDNVGGQVR